MPVKRRPLDAADLAAWETLAGSVTPLRHRQRPKTPAPVVKPEPPPRARSIVPQPAPALPAQPQLDRPLDSLAGIDRRNADRFRRGELPIEGKLDLHGMTQEEAHRMLASFISRNAAAGRRCLLVVTGKGRGGAPGVLKNAVPHWLNEGGLRTHILATAAARQHHGGGGAIYILLKRKR
jgi:DNA-nicking Smr family endonuclease